MPRLIIAALVLALFACADPPSESSGRMTQAEQRLRASAARSQALPAASAKPHDPSAPAPAGGEATVVPWREPGFSYGPATASVSFELGPPPDRGAPMYGSTEARVSGVEGPGRASWVAAELSHGLVFFLRDGGLIGWQRIRRDGKAVMEVPGDGMEAVAVIPGKGVARMTRKERRVEPLDPSHHDRRYDRVELSLEGPLTMDSAASLPRPGACLGDPFSSVTEALLPGLCLTHPAADAMRASARTARYDPPVSRERTASVSLTFGPDGPSWHRLELGYWRSEGSEPPDSIHWSVLAEHRGAPAAMLRLLRESLGAPEVTLSEFAGKPRGDAFCGTPVPPSTTARWRFHPPPGFASVEVTATASTGTSADEVLARATGIHFRATRAR